MSKRRTFTTEFKAKAVLAILSGAKSTAEVCREHQVKESVVARWKQQFLERASEVFEKGRRMTQPRPGLLNWSGWSASKRWSWRLQKKPRCT